MRYTEKHYPENQENWIESYCIDPVLPSGFYTTAHSERDPLEMEHWWNRPYILSQDRGNGYFVCCLDGGAWDRPTDWELVTTLEAAVERCKKGCCVLQDDDFSPMM